MNTAKEHDHISYSQINTYTTCTLKYRFNYIDRLEPEFTSSALVFRSAMHAGIQAYLQSILEADPLRPNQILDVFREEWRGICRASWKQIRCDPTRYWMYSVRSGGAQKDERFGTRHENHRILC
jgi:hypothetical protein